MNKTDTTSRARLIPKTCIQRCCWCSYLGTPCHPSQWRSTVWCLGSSVCFSLGGFRQNHDASIHRESSLAHPQTWLALLRSLFNLFLCRLILRKLINWSPNRSLAWAAVCVCDNYQWDDSEVDRGADTAACTAAHSALATISATPPLIHCIRFGSLARLAQHFYVTTLKSFVIATKLVLSIKNLRNSIFFRDNLKKTHLRPWAFHPSGLAKWSRI